MTLAATARGAPACDGGHVAFALAGAEVVCLPSGALWLADERILVAADLHLEKGSFYARGGQFLPPYDTRDTLDRLEAVTQAMRPRALVLLGDTFHDRKAESRLGVEERARLTSLGMGLTLIWVLGNHDRAGPRALPGDVAPSVAAGPVRLTHEPDPGAPPGEIAGHLHPCARVRGGGGSVRRRCFATDGRRIILPAFGALAGGLNVRDAAFAPLLGQRRLVLVLGQAAVHPVPWRSLGPD